MREFADADGQQWIADVAARETPDYKGQFHLVMRPAVGGEDVIDLSEVRWNSERSARRTIQSMSLVELRRRLRSALGRGVSAAMG
jgi:hypothetical protein